MYTFRPARAEDSSAVRAVVAAVLHEYGLEFDAANSDADLADIPTHYASRRGAFQIVESPAGGIVGCGGLYHIDADTVELRKMYLLPDARGHGIGKKLLTQLLAEARRLGYKRVVLETNSVLKGAIVLYRRFGFVPIDREHIAKRCDQAWELCLSAHRLEGEDSP
jgi:putative acetyltransferase